MALLAGLLAWTAAALAQDGPKAGAEALRALVDDRRLIVPYIPDRVDEGYGLNLEALTALRAKGVGKERVEAIVDAEAFGIAGDSFHADLFGDPHRHEVPRLLDPGAQRRRAVELVRGILGTPEALRRVDLDRRVDNDRRGREPAVERGGIDEGLEG